jgi:hypothetical protein
MQDQNEDTEWNDILRAKGIIPEKQKEKEITEDDIVSMLEQTVKEKSSGKKLRSETRNEDSFDFLQMKKMQYRTCLLIVPSNPRRLYDFELFFDQGSCITYTISLLRIIFGHQIIVYVPGKAMEDMNLDELDELEDDEEERILEQYRRQRMAQIKDLTSRSKFGDVRDISADDYVAQVRDFLYTVNL